MKDLYSLQKLFSEKIFRIPDYQRGYSWNEQQLKEFWEDVLNIPNDREHYTGMISLKEIKDITDEKWNDDRWLSERDYKFYHIVDGQQRMTTFIILVNEIVKYIENLPENINKKDYEINLNSFTLKDIKEKYLFMVYPNSNNILKSYKFGYEFDNPSYLYFKNKILEEETTGQVEETFYTLNLQYAKDFFKDAIKSLHEKNNKNIECISKLFTNLTQKLKFNIYYIDDDFNVFIAFETMNNRGKKLSYLELLKNRLIYLTTLFKNDEAVIQKVRTKINDTWKDIYSYLGKNKEKALSDDEFLQAHWTLYFGYSRNNKDNYNNFLLNKYFIQNRVLDTNFKFKEGIENIDQEEISDIDNEEEINIESLSNIKEKLQLKDIDNYIDSLKEMIPYWYALHYPEDTNLDNDIKLWLSKLNRLQYAYFKPLTCVVLSKKDILADKKIEYLKSVERWIFVYFRLCTYFQTYRNSYFYNLARDLNWNKINIEKVLEDLKEIDVINEEGIISTQSVMARIDMLKSYKGYYSWGPIRYFLYEYELHLKGKNGTDVKLSPEVIFKKDDKDKISIEHIYPQTDTNNYWTDRFGQYPEKSKFFLANSLGNLLPLSMSINSSFQNDSFDDKKNGTNRRQRCYANGCYSEMKVAEYNDWNPDTIRDRGLDLLKFMEERWRFKFNSEEDMLKILYFDKVEKDESIIIEKTDEKYFDINEKIKHLTKVTSTSFINIFNELHDYIMSLNNSITYRYNSVYIGYKLDKNFIEIWFHKNNIQILLRPGEYDDPSGKLKKLPDSYNWVNNMEYIINGKEDIDNVKHLIKQSYEKIL